MGGNICGISAWRLTCCIYAQRESSIHHRAVILRLSGLSGRRGTRRKISGRARSLSSCPHLYCLALGPAFPGSVTGFWLRRNNHRPPPTHHPWQSKDRVIVPVMPLTSCMSSGEALLITGLQLSCEMGRLRISAFKVGSAMIQNLRGGG